MGTEADTEATAHRDRRHRGRQRRDRQRRDRQRWDRQRWDWQGDWQPDWHGESQWERNRDGRRAKVSVMLALLVFLIEVVGVHIAAVHQPDSHKLNGLGYTLLAVSCVALAVRVRARVATFAVTLAATVAYVLLDYPYGPVFLALLISLFGAVRTGHRVGVWVSMAAGYLVFIGAGRVLPTWGPYTLRQPSLGSAIQVAVWFAFALAVAEAIRNRSAHFGEIRRAAIEKNRARAEQERRQSSEERLRIAQELHDVLGHHLSLINVQAGVGLHLMAEQPEQARVALEAIKQASAEALSEVRAVLGALRPKDERAPRAPGPTLADLATLIEPERTVVRGEARALPPEVDRAAFRIVQESLTNVRRHAGPAATATVTIGYEPDRLTVRVTDDGIGPEAGSRERAGGDAPDAAGTGIAGMRTRADALGGMLVTGAGPDGRGFVVSASLPTRTAASRTAASGAPASTGPAAPAPDDLVEDS